MSKSYTLMVALLYACAPSHAQEARSFDAASAFGARASISHLSLSPDGMSVAYVTPSEGQGSAAFTLGLAKGSVPKLALTSDGKPFRLERCDWVSGERLVCTVFGLLSSNDKEIGLLPVSRVVAVNSDGTNLRLLSTRDTARTRGFQLGGGGVIDWLPDEAGAVPMVRAHLPGEANRQGKVGVGVDWIDTSTLAAREVEPPAPGGVGFLSDGRGTVRIMESVQHQHGNGQQTGILAFFYRLPGSREWRKLGDYDETNHEGFLPLAVDHDLNVAYGFKKLDGRAALYSVTLDASPREALVYENPDVDVAGLIRIGRRQRVVGVAYATDIGHARYFAPEIRDLLQALAKALPQQPLLRITDSSVDESRMLVFAGSDSDPGVYYIFDRKASRLETFLVARNQLEGVQLAKVKPIKYPAGDGVLIPGYLTLPPGHEDAKGIPAIVLPHGGPSARDEWGFDWVPQFYAARGFAVLQPNFRGSSGYGDAWFEKNGFKSWRIAIDDVLAAGRWLVSEGIADPAKLGIVGWSYGGYAALQSAVTDPTVFKAVVAIAPVTDLAALKDEHRRWTDYNLVRDFVGDGPYMHEGSPVEHADKIKVPVLLFHGSFDRTVGIDQSKHMAAKLSAAGAKCELVTFEGLDHGLEDSSARAQMLSKSAAFLRQAFGMPPEGAALPQTR
jgi:acetyl esterase/lipase